MKGATRTGKTLSPYAFGPSELTHGEPLKAPAAFTAREYLQVLLSKDANDDISDLSDLSDFSDAEGGAEIQGEAPLPSEVKFDDAMPLSPSETGDLVNSAIDVIVEAARSADALATSDGSDGPPARVAEGSAHSSAPSERPSGAPRPTHVGKKAKNRKSTLRKRELRGAKRAAIQAKAGASGKACILRRRLQACSTPLRSWIRRPAGASARPPRMPGIVAAASPPSLQAYHMAAGRRNPPYRHIAPKMNGPSRGYSKNRPCEGCQDL